jgi:hypothetical protein
MRQILVITFNLCIIVNGYAQNKKEQIEQLASRVDSLTIVIESNEKTINAKDESIRVSNKKSDSLILANHALQAAVDSKNAKISTLEIELADISNLFDSLSIEHSTAEKTIQEKENQLRKLKQRLQELTDSLVSANPQLDTLLWEINELTWDQVEFNLQLVLPLSKFNQPVGRSIHSKDGRIKLEFDYNFTQYLDQNEGVPLFFKKQDAIDHYSKGLKNVKVSNDGGFIISGANAANELIYIKGIYSDFESMQGREEGEPSWLWSNTITMKATVNAKYAGDYDAISKLLSQHFTFDSIVMK